ncbi:uncharacterized protein [Tenebrio molitor]|uniref:uncharacterized protein n=1 Tax=Tenebrio molitor TaxID=7067 RepID=UPI003624A671
MMSVASLCHISTLFFITASINFGTGVKINKLQVPEVIKHGASVILDCDFTLEDREEDLVVKWYFNKNKTLVYQWIPALKPQGLGILKDRLNLEYAASVDANSVHRALHILKAVPDLSGDYTCSVSTLQSEDIRTKSMLVFVPEKELLLRRLDAEEGLMRVQCLADGVFPRPVMSLRSQEREIEETEVTARLRGQLYEVSATATLPALKDPEEFSCELRIPQANYTVRRETVFYPGNKAPLILMDRWLALSPCIFSIYLGLTRQFIGLC